MEKRLIFFILVFLICASRVNAKCTKCYDEKGGKRKEDEFINREIYQQIQSTSSKIVTKPYIRPNTSNIYNPSARHNDIMRHRRNANHKPDFNFLKMKLNEEKRMKLKDFMAADARPRIENNTAPLYGGVNTESSTNKKFDNLKKVFEFNNAERVANYVRKGTTECDFEDECKWTWKQATNGFFINAGVNITTNNQLGPKTDANNNEQGHYLMIRLKTNHKETDTNWTVSSPTFDATEENCKLQLFIYQEHMNKSIIKIIIHSINKTQVMVDQLQGNNHKKWEKYEKAIGRLTQSFNILLEVDPLSSSESIIAFDNIKLVKCYPETDKSETCTPNQYQCATTNLCIENSEVCDINQDCLYGDDETQNCDKVPFGARCTFEQDLCGWYNEPGKVLKWTRHNGPATFNSSGLEYDHTYKNRSGKYLHVEGGREVPFASAATLKSVIFNPPPPVHSNTSSKYYQSCKVRLYLHQYGNHKNGFMLQATELRPKENISYEIYWSYNNFNDPWARKVMTLPNITHRYFLHFDFRKGIRYVNNMAIDDLSLSPECFGLNIPASELNGYNYWNPYIEHAAASEPHPSFENETYYEIKTCNATGRYGPSQINCTNAYAGTPVHTQVLREPGYNGMQKWTVPSEGYYTFILFGASGGKGSGAMGSTRGAMTRIVMELQKGQDIYVLVGQEGTSACIKSLGHNVNSSCQALRNNTGTGVRAVLKMEINDGGGGGGGATYVFIRNKTRQPVPLAIAAGGGGLGLGRFVDTGHQHGQAINMSKPPITGIMHGDRPGGAGGGWRYHEETVHRDLETRQGKALMLGGIGGEACYNSIGGKGDGGFGGGGGGCSAGGGGGGYAGGDGYSSNRTSGDGGYSFVDPLRTLPNFSESLSGYHAGAGAVLVIPAVPGCGCDYRCLALDAKRSQVACICPKNWKLAEDRKSCIAIDTAEKYPTWFVIVLIISVICLSVILFIVLGFMGIWMYNRYQQQKEKEMRTKMISGPDLQLNRLRVASDGMMTEYNPNYEFGGAVYTLKDLKEIPRDQLRLVKALGQGAFGEVYQGFYRQRSGDTVEMPVAVKTLPEMSTNQAEMDFLMEALIMFKFNHPNIVHFIGVCFDKHPRFIVLELLAGGDLKNFLRESRPKPERTSPLTMKDLILITVDVANGCKYLEEKHFIHRDIAARNCLLTTKGPGRVVKIADFGMSRDIYRSDYYRKGGKAMLPIKWMPPEAFLDGIFTSKTDVWSFGVLLWEIMSMGYMPYTGCANRDVMQLVTSGGRLEPPANCPGPIYGIMTQCWHPVPEQRPTFALILERLGYCMQDPQVMNAPLPVFNRLPSHERDATVMRPNTSDDNCLQVPQTTDYLVPNHAVNQTHVVGSTSSIDKLLPEKSDSWETSFTLPQSKSTQPLINEGEVTDEAATGSVEKLLGADQRPPASISPAQNNIHNNHINNNLKLDANLKSGISLDAGALVKQTMPTNSTKYSNVKSTEVTGNGVIQNGPYSNQNKYTSEISC